MQQLKRIEALWYELLLIVGVNRNTVNRYFNIIREKIFKESLKETEKEIGTFELEESYFGAKRVEVKGEEEQQEKHRSLVY